MARLVRYLPGADRRGKSLALAELLDGYGSEIVADLLELYSFDIQAWIRGDTYASVTYVLSLIAELPEGARFTSRYHFDQRDEGDGEAIDPEVEAWLDSKYWNGDRMLGAQIINAIRELTMVAGAGKWRKGKEPEYPVVGPKQWREKDSKKKPEDQKASVSERLHSFFFGG